ncbi:hypothetical protein HZS_2776 [Henneguya salminicola]|nr:hypothetical protein HZS_2776 [Henneguya salminicola]
MDPSNTFLVVIKTLFSLSSIFDSFQSESGKCYWMSDDISISCFECETKFTATTRRHHCRLCYWAFCNSCCNVRSSEKGLPNDYSNIFKFY